MTKTELKQITQAFELIDRHRKLCAMLSSHKSCDKCIAKDECWERKVGDILSELISASSRSATKKK